MDDPALSPEQKRESWWRAQRNDFGLPKWLYAPLPFAVVLAVALGVGGSFLGLYPGVNTHAATLSGEGAPWIGLVILLAVAGLWYWGALRRGYSPALMAAIVGIALGIAVLITSLALDVLVVEQPDATIGGLGLAPIFGSLLIGMGLLFDGFVLGVLMGALVGAFLGGLAGFPISVEAILIMALIYSPIGALAGGISGILRPLLVRRRR